MYSREVLGGSKRRWRLRDRLPLVFTFFRNIKKRSMYRISHYYSLNVNPSEARKFAPIFSFPRLLFPHLLRPLFLLAKINHVAWLKLERCSLTYVSIGDIPFWFPSRHIVKDRIAENARGKWTSGMKGLHV